MIRVPQEEITATATVFVTVPSDNSFAKSCHTALKAKKKWRDREYRQAYMQAAVEQGIAWQVRVNREERGMSQAELARAINTKQSSISRMEDPEYGSHSLPTLLRVANAFDCALLVKLVPYSILAAESRDLSPERLFADSYENEMGEHRV